MKLKIAVEKLANGFYVAEFKGNATGRKGASIFLGHAGNRTLCGVLQAVATLAEVEIEVEVRRRRLAKRGG